MVQIVFTIVQSLKIPLFSYYFGHFKYQRGQADEQKAMDVGVFYHFRNTGSRSTRPGGLAIAACGQAIRTI